MRTPIGTSADRAAARSRASRSATSTTSRAARAPTPSASAAGARLSGIISGGSGDDTLDYSAYTTSVCVDLASCDVTATARVNDIQLIIGGAGADTLAGP